MVEDSSESRSESIATNLAIYPLIFLLGTPKSSVNLLMKAYPHSQ